MQTKKQKNANVVSEVNATLAPAIANEVPATVETPKAVKVPALSEAEKNAIKAAKAAKIVSLCNIPANVVTKFLKEGATFYPSNEKGEKALTKALGGIDKLSVKDGEISYFFYKNPLPLATLTEIFGAKENVPAAQKFSTGGENFNPFIRVKVEKIPALVAASFATPYALELFASVMETAKKAAEKTAKAATTTEVVKTV